VTESGDGSAQKALQVCLLGPPEIRWAGETLEIPRRQPRAILYFLAAHAEPTSRDRLCLLFWPDVSDSEARRHLSNQVYNLRRALPDPDIIRTSAGQLALDGQRSWSDVLEFERLSRSSDSNKLQKAVYLYRGPFLDGFSVLEGAEFSLWVDRERYRLEQRYLETLFDLMEIYKARGERDAAIACARGYLEIDDLAEEVHRQLIALYAAEGNRRAALRQYEQCSIILERELGVDPLPETRELYLTVLADRGISAETTYTAPAWTTLPSLEAPLIGRVEAMTQLKEAFSQACAGVGKAVLISGEAGLGKSRLLQEFVTERAGEAVVLFGSGYEAQGEIPYLPLVEALRPLLSTIDWTSLGADRLILAQLLRLLPELRQLVPGLPDSPSVEQQQEDSPLFRGLAHLVLCLARQHPPLILCLDDLHWTDETTRSWIGYLGRQLRKAPLLLLGGYRTEEAEGVEPLRSGLARLDVLDEVRLQGLALHDVGHLISRLSGKQAGHEQFYRSLHRLTDGNPFFLLETLRIIFEVGLLKQDERGWRGDLNRLSDSLAGLPWPDSVTGIVRRRLSRLHPTASQVLEAGAVLGQRFDLDLVQVTSGRTEQETVDALDELEARQLITVGQRQVQFRHDLLRSIVEKDLSYGRRRLLNRRAGETLEKQEPGNVVALARHFAAAGEANKAINYALQAGKQARLMYAFPEAVDHYQRAVQLLKAEGKEERAARTLMTLGLTYHSAFQFEKSRAAYAQAFTLHQQAAATAPARSLQPAPHPLRLSWFEPRSVDPGLSTGVGGHVIRLLFSGLLARTPELEIVPDLAHSWEVLERGQVYVFHLRYDAHWSDGKPLTAIDVEFAWKRVLDPVTDSPFANELYVVKGGQAFHSGALSDPDQVGVHALDDVTLLVELEQPTGYFLQLLPLPATFPIPRHTVQAHGDKWADLGKIVTSGPFHLQAWQPGERIVLDRNPNYYGSSIGNVERIEFVMDEERRSLLDRYEAGELDVIFQDILSPEQMEQARHRYAEDLLQEPDLSTAFIAFDVRRPPFADPRIRRALAMALDRESLVQEAWKGLYAPAAGGLVPPGMPGHVPGIALPYDPEEARTLLAEAGYSHSKGIPDVEAVTWGEGFGWQGVQNMAGQWRDNLGLEITWQRLEPRSFLTRVEEDPPHMWFMGWSVDYPDPHNFLGPMIDRYLMGWKHDAFRKLLRQAQSTTDQSQRMILFRQAEQILVEQAPLIPVLYWQKYLLLKPWVRRYPLSAMDIGFYHQVLIELH
jgi:ABC-type oligopeptide transport system substrate-binding subunit/DNA-binding SARP family transcriptional activator